MSGPAYARRASRTPAPRGLITAMVVLLILLIALFHPQRASAHAVLEQTAPASGAVVPVDRVPDEVRLAFDESVEVGLGAVEVFAADGGRVDTGPVEHPGGNSRLVAVRLRDGLGQGSFLVMWRVVSADSHPVSGSFTFSVGRPGRVAAARWASAPAITRWALRITRSIEYAALLGLVGAFAFAAFCMPQAWSERRWRWLTRACVLAALLAVAADVALQAADDLGAGVSGAFDGAAIRALLVTQFGRGQLIAAGCALLAGAVVCRRRGKAPSRTAKGSAACCLGAALLAVGWGGHAGAGAGVGWRLPVDALHLASAGVWLGGLMTLLVLTTGSVKRPAVDTPASPVHILVPAGAASGGDTEPPGVSAAAGETDPSVSAGDAALRSAITRFSTLAAGCVVVLVGSGMLQAWYQVREWAALTGTDYGHLLIAKTVLVALILAAAAFSRRWVRSGNRPIGALLRTVGFEAAGAAAVLVVTAVLSASAPARTAYRPPVARTVEAGPVTVQLSTVSRGPREIDVHVYTFNRSGLIRDVPNLRMAAEQPGDGNEARTVDIPLRHVGSGHFIAASLLLPSAGRWRFQITVDVSDLDAYVADTDLPVR